MAKIKLFYNIHQPLLQGFEGHGWEGHELADGQQQQQSQQSQKQQQHGSVE